MRGGGGASASRVAGLITQKKKPQPLQARLYAWGTGVLLAGLLAAELVYFLSPDDEAGADAAAAIARGRMYQHNVELVGGKGALLAQRFGEWFATLWHGRPLAYTIAVIGLGIAAACFVAARLLAPPDPR